MDLLAPLAALPREIDLVMVECLYTWTANRLLALGGDKSEKWRERVIELEEALVSEVEAVCRHDGPALVLVSSEVGLGLPPERARQRAFRDLVGRVNETAAALSDEAHVVVVAGIAIDFKKLGQPLR